MILQKVLIATTIQHSLLVLKKKKQSVTDNAADVCVSLSAELVDLALGSQTWYPERGQATNHRHSEKVGLCSYRVRVSITV